MSSESRRRAQHNVVSNLVGNFGTVVSTPEPQLATTDTPAPTKSPSTAPASSSSDKIKDLDLILGLTLGLGGGLLIVAAIVMYVIAQRSTVKLHKVYADGTSGNGNDGENDHVYAQSAQNYDIEQGQQPQQQQVPMPNSESHIASAPVENPEQNPERTASSPPPEPAQESVEESGEPAEEMHNDENGAAPADDVVESNNHSNSNAGSQRNLVELQTVEV